MKCGDGMSDLISRSELLQEFEIETYIHRGGELWHITGIKAMIENAPAIEAAPVVHGQWIAQDEGLTKFMCSICKGKNYGGHEKFCPNCGADMRKKV